MSSIVVNKPRTENKEIEPLRSSFEHRALWLLLLCREAEKKGLKWEDFAPEAITKNGELDGKDLIAAQGKTLAGLYNIVFTPLTQQIFDMDIKLHTDKAMYADFHYCPLVTAWQKQGCTDEEIARLCDISMCGDHEIAKTYGGKLELPKCIAKGDDYCELRFSMD